MTKTDISLHTHTHTFCQVEHNKTVSGYARELHIRANSLLVVMNDDSASLTKNWMRTVRHELQFFFANDGYASDVSDTHPVRKSSKPSARDATGNYQGACTMTGNQEVVLSLPLSIEFSSESK